MSLTSYLQNKNSNYVTTCLSEKRNVKIFIMYNSINNMLVYFCILGENKNFAHKKNYNKW